MKTDFSGLAVVVLAGTAFLGCGGSTSHDTTPIPDSGSPVIDAAIEAEPEAAPPVDHGAPSTNYPAFKPDVGQVVYQGGTVLKQPVIVPVTWNTDPNQGRFETYADTIGASPYWHTIGKDYSVGAATSGGHAHNASTPPGTLTDQDIQNLILANTKPGSALDAGTGTGEGGTDDGGTEDGGTEGGAGGSGTLSAWPAPTPNTIYALFLAPATSLLIQSYGSPMPTDACSQGIGGYHGSVTSPVLGGDVAYAVVPNCKFGGGSVFDQTTSAMSHELIEAATDPFSSDMNIHDIGWYSFDQNHFDWMYFNELQSEVGDTCEFYYEAFYTNDSSFPYYLQRMWSNSSIAAGHHPCVPVPPEPYFNVTPLDKTSVTVTLPGVLFSNGMSQTTLTRGVRVPAGKTATFMVGFYSDADTGGAWTISATAGNPILGARGDFLSNYNQSSIAASIDKTSGVNGEKAQVTVSVASTGATFNGELLTITSTLNGTSHYMPVWIAGQ
jgi:hypothetical protein